MTWLVYSKDRQRLVELLLANRVATDVRLYPTIWRVLLLLTSRVWAPEEDVRLWENAAGELAGFAMLWCRQPSSPYLVLDWFVHPSLVTGELLIAMLTWGDQRAQEIANERNASLALYTHAYVDLGHEQSERVTQQAPNYTIDWGEAIRQSQSDAFMCLGFLPLPPNPEEHNIYFARSLKGSLPEPELPTGYTIQRLQGKAALEAYRTIYGFARVDPLHQQEQLASDEYCCLVVSNPDGQFAAYCECSIWRAEWELTGRRVGWIDFLETREAEQGKGLGRAVLLSALAQLQTWGADTAMLVTINTNAAAVRLYEKSGFELVDIKEPARYEKIIVCSPAT